MSLIICAAYKCLRNPLSLLFVSAFCYFSSVPKFRMKGSLIALLALSATPFVVLSGPLGYTQVNGVTRLFGTSFGVIGIDETFDYVVS